jgi:hypothetical protein
LLINSLKILNNNEDNNNKNSILSWIYIKKKIFIGSLKFYTILMNYREREERKLLMKSKISKNIWLWKIRRNKRKKISVNKLKIIPTLTPTPIITAITVTIVTTRITRTIPAMTTMRIKIMKTKRKRNPQTHLLVRLLSQQVRFPLSFLLRQRITQLQ